MKRLGRVASLAVLLLVVAVPLLYAQGTSVNGRVVDQQNAAVSGATVTLAAPGQPARTARAGSDGSFSFANVAPTIYMLRVEAAGFTQATQQVTVAASAVTVNVPLQIAGVVEALTVQGAAGATTATAKSTQPLRNLPLTVQSIPNAMLTEQASNDLVTALQNTAGAYAFTTYGVYEYYTFRGFFDSAQLVDGIRNDEPNRLNSQLANVDRVEILKGPSSVLYGAGALGATVNIIPKKPSATPAYEFMGAFGSFKTGRAELSATGPLKGDAVRYRVDFGFEGRDGYRHDDARRATVAPSLSWRIGSADQLNVRYIFNRDHFGGDAGLPLVDTSLGVPTDQNVLNVPHDRNYRTPYDDATDVDHNLQAIYTRQLTNSIGFTNALSYRQVNELYFLSEEVDFIAPRTIDRYYLYFNHHRRPLANLAQVNVHVSRGIAQDLLFAWDFQRFYDYTTLPASSFFQAESIDAFNPVETQGPTNILITRQSVATNYTNGFYAQDHLTLGPQVKLLVGGRGDVYRSSSRTDNLTGSQPVEGPSRKVEVNAFTGRVGLVYQPMPREDVYGSWANSFTPLNAVQLDGSSLKPQSGTQWEIGQRTRFLNDRMEATAAVYRILRQNVPFGRPGGVIVQAGEVESKGVEFDLNTSVATNWRVNVGYAYTDAKFLDYEESPGVNRRGNTPQFAPKHTLNIWTGYDWKNGVGVNVGARYFGEVFADSGNEFAVKGYGLLNLAARYRRGPLEYALNLNNVSDTTYYVPHLDYLQVYPGQPFNVLATVRVRLR